MSQEYQEFLDFCREHELLNQFGRILSPSSAKNKEEKKYLQEIKDKIFDITSFLPENKNYSYRQNLLLFIDELGWACPACGEPRKYSSEGGKFEITCGKKDQDHHKAIKKEQYRRQQHTRATSGKDYSRTEEAQKQFEETCLEKYGSASPLGNKEIQEKGKQTLLDTLGVDNAMKSPEIRAKASQTYKEKTGYDNSMKNPKVQEKAKITNNEKYGGNSPMHSPDVRKIMEENNISKYGVSNPTMLPEIREKLSNSIRIAKSSLPTQIQRTKLSKEFIEKNFTTEEGYIEIEKFTNFMGYATNVVPYQILKEFKVEYKKRSGVSAPEEEIVKYIKSLDPSTIVIRNARDVIPPKEIDIYLPQYNIAIEYNGIMWHSHGVSKFSCFNNPDI